MALVTYNPSVKGFHGSVHDLVFYTIKGRNILRTKGTVEKPQSAAQKAMREAFKNAAACWRELSQEQKEPWRVYGTALGMTGYNAFQKVNIPRLKVGLPIALTVPVEGKPVQAYAWSLPDTHAQTQVTNGCARFMESIHEMVERVSKKYVRITEEVRSI